LGRQLAGRFAAQQKKQIQRVSGRGGGCSGGKSFRVRGKRCQRGSRKAVIIERGNIRKGDGHSWGKRRKESAPRTNARRTKEKQVTKKQSKGWKERSKLWLEEEDDLHSVKQRNAKCGDDRELAQRGAMSCKLFQIPCWP